MNVRLILATGHTPSSLSFMLPRLTFEVCNLSLIMSVQMRLRDVSFPHLCQSGACDHETIATLVGIWPCTGCGPEQETYLSEDDLLAQLEAWQPVSLCRCWHVCYA